MAHPLPRSGGRSPLPLFAVLLLSLAYALLFGWLSLSRYWAYEMHALDMGNMGQAAWNTIHGHPFYFTNMRLPYQIEAWGTTTRLSFHVEYLYPLIALTYLIYPHPESLLILQTVALALGALPVYFLARDLLGIPWLAAVMAAAYLLFPSLEAMNLYEFHPVALATPLLLAAFLFAERRRYGLFLLCCFLAAGTKEQIGLVVALFGLYVLLVQRQWRVGLIAILGGTFWSLFATLVVEHHYRPPGTVTYLRSRYGYLGHGLHGALQTIRHEPGIFARVMFTWPKAAYVEQLFAPFGFLAFFGAPFLFLGISTVGLNLLSQDPHMFSALGDNSAELIAVSAIASIYGARTVVMLLAPRISRRAASIATGAFILLASLWSQHLNGFAPLGSRFEVPAIGNHQHIEDRFVAMIPPSVPVSTQDQLDPHLSSRHYLYLFRDTGRPPDPPLVPANYILLDASAPTYPLPSGQLHAAAMEYIHRAGWGVQAADDGLILIRKGARSKQIPPPFYSYMIAGTARPQHRLGASIAGLDVLGYDVRKVDLPNHRIPALAYTFYLRPTHRIGRDLQPVVYEKIGNALQPGCPHFPLGLAWLPTSRWTPGRTYIVRMDTLETDWSELATAHFFMSLQPTPTTDFPSCSQLWAQRGRLVPVGTMQISFST